MSIHIRWMTRHDLPGVMEVEEASYVRPWSESDLLATLRRREVIGYVVESFGVVHGFFIYSLRRHSIRLLKLVVHPEHRRFGVGRAIVGKLTGKLSPVRRDRIVADVPERHLVAQQFMRACGFRAVAVVADACEDGSDAYRFEYVLTNADASAVSSFQRESDGC